MSQIGVALDIVIAVLLVATIVYASVLNRKLAVLRNTKQEMEALAGRLVESTAQAERALAALKAAAGESGAALDARVGEARTLSEDLTFLLEKGGALADRLEGQLGRARAAAPAARDAGAAAANLGRAQAPAQTAPAEAEKPASAGGKPADRRGGAGVNGGKPRPRPVEAAGRLDEETDDTPPADTRLLRALRGVR